MNLNNKRFFKWDVARNYPVPFDGTTEKRRNVEINGSKRAVTIIPGLVSAAVALAEEELGLATKSHLHLQIGTAPTGSGFLGSISAAFSSAVFSLTPPARAATISPILAET